MRGHWIFQDAGKACQPHRQETPQFNGVCDLTSMPKHRPTYCWPTLVSAKFGVVMERTRNELRGISCLALEEVAAPRKQIISSRSFGQLVHTLPELSESVASYSAAAKAAPGKSGSCVSSSSSLYSRRILSGGFCKRLKLACWPFKRVNVSAGEN
jgi:hypothetical protein